MTFPRSITDTLAPAFVGIADSTGQHVVPESHVVKRRWRPTDPNLLVAVVEERYKPISYCFGPEGRRPDHVEYTFSITTFVKHTSEQDGADISSDLGAAVRVIVDTDESLDTALKALSFTPPGSVMTERVSLVEITDTAYFQDEADGMFGFITLTTVRVVVTT